MVDLEKEILQYIAENPYHSSSEIHEGVAFGNAYATTKRALSSLIKAQHIIAEGKGKGTKYRISSTYALYYPIDVEKYFEKEIDERQINDSFNLHLMSNLLINVSLFTKEEDLKLQRLQNELRSTLVIFPKLNTLRKWNAWRLI